MTPANPDALVEALAQYYREEHSYLRSTAAEKARTLVAGPLAPLLADLQRVTAERDEAREDQKATETAADDGPTDAEIQAMHEEAKNFRLPAPPPPPVRDPYYLTECEHCGWVGSSEQCGGDAIPGDDDIICAVCCRSICGDSPDEADTAKHGEAVYQRILTAESRAAQLQAEVEAKDRALTDLEEAARPFAACVFNDNGDVTLSTGRLDVYDWLRLDRAQRTALAARAATAREG